MRTVWLNILLLIGACLVLWDGMTIRSLPGPGFWAMIVIVSSFIFAIIFTIRVALLLRNSAIASLPLLMVGVWYIGLTTHYSRSDFAHQQVRLYSDFASANSTFKNRHSGDCSTDLASAHVLRDPFTQRSYLISTDKQRNSCKIRISGPDQRVGEGEACFFRMFMQEDGLLRKTIFVQWVLGRSDWSGDLLVVCAYGKGCNYDCHEPRWHSWIFDK